FLLIPPPPPALHRPSLHDALPIWRVTPRPVAADVVATHGPNRLAGTQHRSSQRVILEDRFREMLEGDVGRIVLVHVDLFDDHGTDRKSTRLNSSHVKNSYAVFCLK